MFLLRTRDKEYKLPGWVNLLEAIKRDAISTETYTADSNNIFPCRQGKLASFLASWDSNFQELFFMLVYQSVLGCQKAIERLAVTQPLFIQRWDKLHWNYRRFCNYWFAIKQSSSIDLPNWKSVGELQVGRNSCARNSRLNGHQFSCQPSRLMGSRKRLKQIASSCWCGQYSILCDKSAYALLSLNSASSLKFIYEPKSN